jgi:predicted metal-dependent enzyme (double-stranded beta helix superfamily)
LHGIALTDDQLGTVTCPAVGLAPGRSMTCHAVKVTTTADVARGHITNHAVVTGRPPAGHPVTGTDTATVTTAGRPAISVSKTAAPVTYSAPGTAIAYTYVVVNTGTVALHDVTAVDNRLGAVTCASRTLNPGQSTTCHGSYVTGLQDVKAGHVANTVTATGLPPHGPGVTAKATANVKVVRQPVIPVTS